MDIEVPIAFDIDTRPILRQPVHPSFFVPPSIITTPVIDRLSHQFHSHTIIFCPLLVIEIRWQACQFKFSLEQIEFFVGDVDLCLLVCRMVTDS